MRTALLGTLLLGLVTAAAASAAPTADPAAVASAHSWLALTDSGDFGASWKAAAPYFQQSISVEKWSEALRAVRTPLGKVVSRKLLSAHATKSLPGAPDGDYVVIQFQTEFANKASAVETITPMRTPDGLWKVSGYFIK